MKTKLSHTLNLPPSRTLALALLLALSPLLPALCQIPQGFNYQALARDASKNPITVPLDVRFTVRADSVTGTIFWEEEHYGVQPNEFGVFNVVVGRGTRISGLAKFSNIDWTVSPKYLMTEINHSGWKFLGSSRLWTVPYAMVADSLGGPLKKLSVKGGTTNMEEALFEVKNNLGKTVFAVYNEGVRVYVADGDAKGVKGGFAVGSMVDSKAVSQDYLFVSGDSVRAYIGPVPTGGKASKGGFAVSGFDGAKKATGQYLRVTRDSTRIYVNDDSKASKGGFAVSGFDGAKGTFTTYTTLTPDNYLIGHKSGVKTTGKYNSFLGYEAGAGNTTGEKNTFIGYNSGFSNLGGSNNVFMGFKSGWSNTSGVHNIFIGTASGYSNMLGGSNVFIGDSTGYSTIIKSENVFIGKSAGMNNTGGDKNVYLGYWAGYRNTSGYSNVFIGNQSGRNNQSGKWNIFLGYFSGRNNINGDKNIMIGYNSGLSNYSGLQNVMLGVESGYSNYSGRDNVFLGTGSGYSNTSGQDNVFMGTNSGRLNNQGCYNVFVGYSSGYKNLGSGPTGFPGNFNVFLGYYSGYENETGQDNVFLGKQSGFWNKSGSANTFIGMNTGGQMSAASNNVLIGTQVGGMKTSGGNNTLIGSYAGYNNGTGASNVFIGYKAGQDETGSGLLYIENSESTTPLIGGDFTNDKVAINGKPDPAGATLQVNGNLKLGLTGNNIFGIIKVTMLKDLPPIAAGTEYVETFSVPNTFISGAIMISPQAALTNGLVISYARVSVNGTVEVKFKNTSASAIDMDNLNWNIAVIQ